MVLCKAFIDQLSEYSHKLSVSLDVTIFKSIRSDVDAQLNLIFCDIVYGNWFPVLF